MNDDCPDCRRTWSRCRCCERCGVITAVSLISVAEIARNYGKSPGHVHLLAHRLGWRRIKWQGRVYYDLADVDKALGKD